VSAFVLDTSAVLAVLNGEDGLETVTSLLRRAEEDLVTVYLPFMALMELEYLLLRSTTPEETRHVLALVGAWPVRQAESDEEWRHLAALVKSTAAVSVADAWNAALALRHAARLVHKDPEYEAVPQLQSLALPYGG